MIYTVTLNPALDKTVEIPSFTTDGVNRITSIRTDPGGKGINVSKVVAALGSTSRALGILGGSTGQMISEALSGLNMTCDFLPVEGNTRINLKVVDPIAHTSTEINEPGVPVDPATLQSLLDHLLKLLRHDDIVVLAGSLPVNAPADTYRVWGDACREKGAKVILDSDGAGMVEGVKAKPFLIKPNSEELSHLMGRALDSQQELTAAARERCRPACKRSSSRWAAAVCCMFCRSRPFLCPACVFPSRIPLVPGMPSSPPWLLPKSAA